MVIPSIQYMLDRASKENCPIYSVVLKEETADSEISESAVYERLEKTFEAMKNAAYGGINSTFKSVSGMTGGDAVKYYHRTKSKKGLLGEFCSRAVSYALATSECNASMGVIVAAPTAGSAGILPGAFIAAKEVLGLNDRRILNGLLTAGGVGAVIAERASLAGAVCGCQAECGSAAAMTAAGLCEMLGGTPEECMNAGALALKNCLGLACDPVAGLVEVPCVKRNGMFTVFAITAADMALAGVKSFIPFDEVIDSMKRIGSEMPACIRETGEGGLAATPTGIEARKKIFG